MTFDYTSLEFWLQAGIVIFGPLASFMVSTTGRYHRWGFVVGICGQPFFIWSILRNEQWGMFIVSLMYTYSFLNGIRNHFLQGKGQKSCPPE